MTAWHEFAGTVVIQVSAIALVALILSACYSRSAARRHTVGVVGLLLILLSPLATPLLPQAQWWRVLTSTEESSVPVVVEPQTDDFSPDVEPPFVMTSDDIGVHERSDDAAAFSPDVGPVDVATPIRDQPPIIAAAVDAPANGSSNWVGLVNLVLTVWGAGSVVSAGIWFARRRRLQRLTRSLDVRPGNEIDGRLQSVVRDVCSAMRIEKLPAIAVSHAVPMPLVLGVWRPVIVIPADLLRDGAEQRLKEVLIHEAAHVVRRDAAINAAQRFVSVLWWWHPLVLWLNRVVSRSREEVCDNHVLGLGDARHYAETLLDLAETCSRAGRIAPSLGLLGTRWTLEKRIQGLLNPRRNMMTRTNCTIAVMFAVLLGMIALLVGGTVTKEPSAVAQVEEWDPARDESGKSLQKVTVRGRCVDEAGSPLADVRVVMVRRSDDYTAHAILGGKTTDNEGRFEFVDVGTAMPKHGDLVVAAALEGYVSALAYLKKTDGDVIEQKITLESNPGKLSGVVRDAAGNPIPDVTVYLSCGIDQPVPGIRSAMTDEDGRYAITDLNRWESKDTTCFCYTKHPDYPKSPAAYSAVPQVVDVTLYPPAIVEGKVIDAVTNEPAADVLVSAQAVAWSGWYQTRTDDEGHYRLRMVRNHYNIWAEKDDRIAIAVKAIEAVPGKTAAGADIRLVRGGFVVGTVFDVDGKPLAPSGEYGQHVAHYGPARPRTGAAVTSVPIEADGTYRLRVAPGENYIYCMGGKGSRGKVHVEDGGEVTFDIDLSAKPGHEPEDADERLARKLREAAREEDAASEPGDSNKEEPRPASQKPTARQRPDTPTGRLLDELAEQNASNDKFEDVWCKTLMQIVKIGPEAVPELIAELDATNDDMMLSCLGFMLRAIDDKRAVPALIRAIPKTLLPPGSDMGLLAEDEAIAAFMQRHDLSGRDEPMRYDFGRPVREIFGALQTLTGQSFDEEELYHVFLKGTEHQRSLKRELFARKAGQWAEWWERHWSEVIQDADYAKVNLPKPKPATPLSPFEANQHFQITGGLGNAMLESYTQAKRNYVFYDIDTGRYAGLPKTWQQADDAAAHLEEIVTWASREGFDMMGVDYTDPSSGQSYYALRPIGLEAWELSNEYWKFSSNDITFEALQAEGVPAAELLLHYDAEKEAFAPAETATFLIKSREGTPVLLFVGIEVKDDSLKPGKGRFEGDSELNPVSFYKGRRFGLKQFEELPETPKE